MLIRCKCGRLTDFGTSCSNCTKDFLDSEASKEYKETVGDDFDEEEYTDEKLFKEIIED